jgi:flagellar FliJ protein
MAKKFNFKLEPVLKYRADKVNQAKDSFNQAVRLRIEKENSILETIDKKNEMLNKVIHKIKAGDLQNNINHINSLNNEILKLENEKNQIIEIENLRRIKLTNAMKDEKVIEKLKEKKIDLYNENLKKDENKFLDELGINSIDKKLNNGLQ